MRAEVTLLLRSPFSRCSENQLTVFCRQILVLLPERQSVPVLEKQWFPILALSQCAGVSASQEERKHSYLAVAILEQVLHGRQSDLLTSSSLFFLRKHC